MKKHMNYMFLVLSIMFQSLSGIFSKFVSDSVQGNILDVVFNTNYILSILCLVLQSFFWQMSLRELPLSIAYPITSISAILILVISFYIFQEEVTINNMIGASIIMLGVTLLATQHKET